MKRFHGLLLAGAGALFILSLTLWPSSGDAQQTIDFWCLLCGSRDAADGVLNLLLFVPFGAGLSVAWGTAVAIGSSFALSGAVELIQTTLPGRFSTFSDILFNTAGGAAGAFLAVFHSRIKRAVIAPPLWLRLLAALAPPAVFAGTAALSAPRFSDGDLYGQWAHEIGSLLPYPGEVISATLGGLPIPDGRVPNQEAVRQALREGEPLLLEAVAGPHPSDLSHLFAIYDDKPQELLLLAVQGSDLIFQRRTWSVELLFDQPFVRWRGAMDAREGDTLRIAVRQEPTALCLEVGQRARCDVAAGVGGGWRLMHRLWGAPRSLAIILGVVWLALLSLPAGALLGTRARGTPVGLALGVLGILLSWWSPWLSPHLVDLLAPIPGAWAGWEIRERVVRRA